MVVLAMVPDYPDSVRVGTGTDTPVLIRNRQGCRRTVSWRVCYPDRTQNRWFLAGLEPARGSNYTVPTALAPIRYLSYDCIMTWSVRKLFCFSLSFTYCIQICNLTDIH